MTINLKHFINQKVTVLLEDGRTYDGMIVDSGRARYALMVNGERLWVYTYDGYVWYDKSNCPENIKSIRLINEMKTNYQELEQKAQEMQKTLDEMNKEISRLKELEKKTKLPGDFSRKYALSFLDKPNGDSLDKAFTWVDTPQHNTYWYTINHNLVHSSVNYKVPYKAILQIQEWVIQSYRQEFGD